MYPDNDSEPVNAAPTPEASEIVESPRVGPIQAAPMTPELLEATITLSEDALPQVKKGIDGDAPVD